MTLLALIAMICGPIIQKDIVLGVQAKNCYKNLITCVEHKQIKPGLTPEDAIQACVLEM